MCLYNYFIFIVLLLPLALQPTVGFGLSNNVLPFFPICHQLSQSIQFFLCSTFVTILFFFLLGWVVSPTPNPQTGRPGYPFLSGSSPLTCLACEALPLAYATVSIALRIMWPHKPLHYVKVGIPSGGFLLLMTANFLSRFLVSIPDTLCSVTPLPFRGLSSSNAVSSFNPRLRSSCCTCFDNWDFDTRDMNIVCIWDETPCDVIHNYKRLGGSCLFFFKGRIWSYFNINSQLDATIIMLLIISISSTCFGR
jgi:hypothetical protein